MWGRCTRKVLDSSSSYVVPDLKSPLNLSILGSNLHSVKISENSLGKAPGTSKVSGNVDSDCLSRRFSHLFKNQEQLYISKSDQQNLITKFCNLNVWWREERGRLWGDGVTWGWACRRAPDGMSTGCPMQLMNH